MPNNITIINQETLRDKIYLIRGIQVMLDYDLACIYGYSTKAFNQQVRNNIDKSNRYFMFRLTELETQELSLRSKNFTLNVSVN